MTAKLEIARLGPGQLKDVERSGVEHHNGWARTCTILQGNPPQSDIGDRSPHRIADLYGDNWKYWDRHFVVQVAGCPLRCPYCYVDNLDVGFRISIEELVGIYADFRECIPELNVFHLMGGCPGRYAHLWPLIRAELDKAGFRDTVFFSNVILVEETVHGACPWRHIPLRSVIAVCLKGTSFSNFVENTQRNLFQEALVELENYIRLDNPRIHYTLLNPLKKDLRWVYELLGEKNVDRLRFKTYEAVKYTKERPMQ